MLSKNEIILYVYSLYIKWKIIIILNAELKKGLFWEQKEGPREKIR